ncbi:MAG TPA: hypothetical protein VIB38_02995 [Aestuariivirgaceae bacterium]|jgi:hypothetical protein
MVETYDHINAVFEILAGGFVLVSVRQILIDKAVAGINLLTCLFFPLWSFWNIFFYDHLGQVLSVLAAVNLAYAETAYFVLLVIYSRPEPENLAPVRWLTKKAKGQRHLSPSRWQSRHWQHIEGD